MADRSRLFIFADGPQSDAQDGLVDRINQVCAVIRENKWCGQVTILESANNKGLSRSIIDGVSQLIADYGKVIVLEDDLVLHSDFLGFMNAGLDAYADYQDVYTVSGYQFPIRFPSRVPDAFFFTSVNSWGWGTWRRAWERFDASADGWEELCRNRKMRYRFDFDDSIDFAEMLEQQMIGQLDSWAIRWYWSVFREDGLSLYPKYSLVRNSGHDGSGIHCTPNADPHDKLVETTFRPQLPTQAAVDSLARAKLVDYWRLQFRHDLWTRTRRKVIGVIGHP